MKKNEKKPAEIHPDDVAMNTILKPLKKNRKSPVWGAKTGPGGFESHAFHHDLPLAIS